MSALELIFKAKKLGIELYLKDNNIAFKATREKMDDEFRAEILLYKNEIIHFFKSNSSQDSIVPLTEKDRNNLPCSFAQQSLWLFDQILGGSSQYNMYGTLSLTGTLCYETLNKAFGTIVERHESLRTYFITNEEGQPQQVIQAAKPFVVNFQDFSLLSSDLQQSACTRYINEECTRDFDLSCDLMLRVHLIKIAQDDHILLVTMHHIASDGWSMGILVNEFSQLYKAHIQGQVNPLPPLPIQYADYAHWQRSWLQGEVLEQYLGYWEAQLAGLPLVHNLPLDHPRPAAQSYNGKTYVSRVDEETSDAMSRLCHAQNATLFMGLHAAFSVLLSRYSNETDIVVGTPIANRQQAEVAGLIGFFVNTLVLRSDLSGNPDFVQLLKQSKAMLLDAYAHQQVPFELLVERLQPERSLSHSPLFQVMLVLQNNEEGSLELPGLSVSSLGQNNVNVVKFDLILTVKEHKSGLMLSWEYNTDLFEASTIERMVAHFNFLLKSLVSAPDERVFAANMLSKGEREQLLVGWNDTSVFYPKDKCIHEFFEAQVENKPNAIALVFEDRQLTYAELNTKANQLAHYLVNEKNVKPDTLVGICIERSLEMVIAILGILKAGGAYVPLDSKDPEARLAYVVNDANLTTLITQRHLLARGSVSEQQSVFLDDIAIQQHLALQSVENINSHQRGLNSNHLAYVIYTSGSTGNPKGVMIEHHSVINLMRSIQQMDLTLPGKQWGWNASYAFDASIQGITQLISGVGLHVIPEECRQDPLLLVNQLGNLSVIDCTPMMVEAWFAAGIDDHLPNLILGGEAISSQLWSLLCEWQEKYNKKAINVYGPTECTVDSTWCVISGKEPHIGRLLNNVQAYILGGNKELLAQGISGELHIGGAGLARGYLNRSDLTAEKYITNPFYDKTDPNSSERLYKTGDLVRWLPDGNLEFLGRNDHQVKIRGFRIELGEIENTLRLYGEVSDIVVVVKNLADSNHLVAYVVTNIADAQTESKNSTSANGDFIERLRHYANKFLPAHMVPSLFVTLEKLPLTVNGKVDRKSLPQIDFSDREHPYVAPRNESEKALCKIWEEVLGVERVGIADNFFHLGGSSLLAASIVSRIRFHFGMDFSVKLFFSNPDVESLALLINTLKYDESEFHDIDEDEFDSGVF